jgi:hypothetical protein
MQPAMPFISLTLITGTLMTLSTSLEMIFEKWLTLLVASVFAKSGIFPVSPTYSKSPHTSFPAKGADSIAFASYPS